MIVQPTCPETEQSLLGACISSECGPPCQPEDFCHPKHRLIAKAMIDLERSGVTPDLVTVCQKVDEASRGEYKASDIVDCLQRVVTPDHLEDYAAIVKEFATARRAQMRAQTFVSQVSDPSGRRLADLVDEFSGDILKLGDTGRQDRERSIHDACKAFVVDLDRRMESVEVVGLPTGIDRLDTVTCGMNKGELWVIAARPSIGKTAISLQITTHVASMGAKVLFFSQDMPEQSLMQRMVSTRSRINMSRIRSGQIDGQQEYPRIASAVEWLAKQQIVISDAPATELDILRKSRKHKPDLVIIDYLQKINPSKSTGNLNNDYGAISKLIKDIAKDLDIPVILLSQLSRGCERENRRPRDSDLRDTGQLEQDADVILFLHSEGNDKTAKRREIIISKQRQGECCLWEMAFVGEYQLFAPLDLSEGRR